MHAKPGDRIVIKGRHVGDSERSGEILEVRGADGTPPYLVRWETSRSVGLFYPGSDAVIEQQNAKRKSRAAADRS